MMELTSAPAAAPGDPPPARKEGSKPPAEDESQRRARPRGTDAPELMVPKSDVGSSSCDEDGPSDREDLGRAAAGLRRIGEGDGEGEGHGEAWEGAAEGEPEIAHFSRRKNELRCSLRVLGVTMMAWVASAALPFSRFSDPPTAGLFAWGAGEPSSGAMGSWRVKTESRSSSELLGCCFSLCFFRLRLAAAKMEETSSSRLYCSFPEAQEFC